MSSISSFDIISVVVQEPKIFFFCILASAADAAAVNPNGIETLLANGNPVLSNGPRRLPRNPPDCTNLDNRIFYSLLSVDKLFAKALRRSATCLLVNNNLCRNVVSSLEWTIIVDDNHFFIANFNLLSCEFDNFTFKLLYWFILYWYYIDSN